MQDTGGINPRQNFEQPKSHIQEEKGPLFFSLLSLSSSTQWAIKGFPSPLIMSLLLQSENISHQFLISITLQCVLYLLLPQLPPSSDQRCLLAQDQFVACWLTMGEDVGFSDPCPTSGTPSQGREGRERLDHPGPQAVGAGRGSRG